MKITIEFNSVEEYLEFKEKTAQEEQVQEQYEFIHEDSINGTQFKKDQSIKCPY
ncbi:Uncharacterised protein [[Clostridium] sordellii]|uniref:Phage protein n=1 Tax=Paraclostridium sordellii TaxID=1505 RepID=A0ABP1XSV7_PARSO|nr:hypothetical protein [Paeniclostridium sordellii]EPZ54748.1 hypothetical protein H477_3889 [[Clostridium] sordellii ATCC 9714] [Paeniclostridium sordellii ATCC 9714]CEJ74253.1 hypothetical protein ATCC9714_21411 [[Clostridium] sordellii] [Paeniclostridium sordellii]CEN69795.1 Uncharacterised protein [[Clostridium] sordellii] [Paeniclostridium sordellii]CEN73063.1 Uncharacterised protein [[Clostridium] sordellii] [Paeniclostridium sordellii]CEO25676.1 Uncharacterised protein [[Clostridium] s